MSDYLLIYQFAIFLAMIPVTFKALTAINFDVLFKRGMIWQKQALIIIWTVILSYLFARAFVSVVELTTIL